MKYDWPIKGIGLNPGIFISQDYYSNPQVTVDTWYGDTLVKAGEYVYARFGLKSHGGLDIAAPLGTPVYSEADGWIIEHTDKPTGFGLRTSVAVDEGDIYRVFVHGHYRNFNLDLDLHWNLSERRYPIKKGDLLGYVDSTGFSTGNHLHLSVYEYDKQFNKLHQDNGNQGQLDPLSFLKPRAFLAGYRKHPEKDFVFRMDSEETLNWFKSQQNLKDKFYLEDTEATLPLDKPPFPSP